MSRLWCDIERYPDDREEMNRVGMGVVYMRDANLNPLYRPGREPDARERERRMRLLYHPYHAELSRLARGMLDDHDGPVLLLDAHTYERKPQPYELHRDEPRPTVIIGANTVEPAGMDAARDLAARLTHDGFDTGVNSAFKGAIRPNGVDDPRLVCIMPEIRRDTGVIRLMRLADTVTAWWRGRM